MRYLGIDVGTKRVGLALSDASGRMAFPHKVIQNDTTLVKTLAAVIETEGVEEIVIGKSLNRDGQPNEVQKIVDDLVTDLTLETGLPIHLEPEFYSTQEAIRFQGRTDETDAAAASVILNSFLTKQKN